MSFIVHLCCVLLENSKQLCINVQLAAEAGGLDGSALYIDTNQGFSAPRMKGAS